MLAAGALGTEEDLVVPRVAYDHAHVQQDTVHRGHGGCQNNAQENCRYELRIDLRNKPRHSIVHTGNGAADALGKQNAGIGTAQHHTAHQEHADGGIDDKLFNIPVALKVGALTDDLRVHGPPQMGNKHPHHGGNCGITGVVGVDAHSQLGIDLRQ